MVRVQYSLSVEFKLNPTPLTSTLTFCLNLTAPALRSPSLTPPQPALTTVTTLKLTASLYANRYHSPNRNPFHIPSTTLTSTLASTRTSTLASTLTTLHSTYTIKNASATSGDEEGDEESLYTGDLVLGGSTSHVDYFCLKDGTYRITIEATNPNITWEFDDIYRTKYVIVFDM